MSDITIADTNRMIGQAVARERLRQRITEQVRHKAAIQDQLTVQQVCSDLLRQHYLFWKNMNGLGGRNGGR